MSLNMDLVGKKGQPIKYKYSWKDCVLYALGVGAKIPDDLNFLWEGNGPKVLPTFAVVPSFATLLDVVGKLNADFTKILHGEQTIILHRPIPSSGDLSTVAEVTGIYDKGSGAVIVIEADTKDESGGVLFANTFSVFLRGEGGFGGERGPRAAKKHVPPERAPDHTIEDKTSPNQAAIYRLSGDRNPLHIDPEFGKMAGFDRPIIHGLCTFGYVGRAVLQAACGGDPARLKDFEVRFAGVAYPGETIITEIWQEGPDKAIVRATTAERGEPVISNAAATIS